MAHGDIYIRKMRDDDFQADHNMSVPFFLFVFFNRKGVGANSFNWSMVLGASFLGPIALTVPFLTIKVENASFFPSCSVRFRSTVMRCQRVRKERERAREGVDLPCGGSAQKGSMSSLMRSYSSISLTSFSCAQMNHSLKPVGGGRL